MPLLSLPPELVYEICTFLTWQDTLSMICTTKRITEEFLSRTTIASLRQQYRSRLLAWETHERDQHGWPLEKDVKRKMWTSYAHHQHHLSCLRIDRWDCLPCYTCLRQLPFHYITTSMKCGPRAVGQERAHERICIECGIRTGFYKPGSRAYYTVVCAKCGSAMHPVWGWKHDGSRFEPFDDRGPETDDPSHAKHEAARAAHAFGFDSYKFTPRRLWWWDYSSECVDCALDAGYTQEELFTEQARRARVDTYYRQQYRDKMFAYLQRRQDRGREIRAKLGLPDPAGLLDLEALQSSDDPFPNYQWTPKRYDLFGQPLRRAGVRSAEFARRTGAIRVSGKMK